MRGRWPFILVLPLLLAACQRGGNVPLPHLTHEAYIWQRQWTPAVTAAATQGSNTFTGYRVLAGETGRDGNLSVFSPDLALLERAQQPVTAVLRINGTDPPPDPSALSAQIAGIAQDWRAAGVRLGGIEIDHDCASARLPAYARLLNGLRARLPEGLKLSITELPAWLDAPALRDVLAQVDESVLQVHAVLAPSTGLFDPALAARWVERHAQVADKPFRVALPAYGMKVGFDDKGHAIGAESEAEHPIAADDVRELRVAPEQVETLLHDLERARPKQVAGIVWFRLPTDDDKRAWSLGTLRAVIGGEPLRPVVKVSFDVDASGAHDLTLANVGAIDAPVPAVLVVAALGCDAGDALDGFRLERIGDDWRFVATGQALIRAGRERHVGWLRCESVLGMKVDEK